MLWNLWSNYTRAGPRAIKWNEYHLKYEAWWGRNLAVSMKWEHHRSERLRSVLSSLSSSRHPSTLCSPAPWWTSSPSSARALRSSRNWTVPTPQWWVVTTNALPRWDALCYMTIESLWACNKICFLSSGNMLQLLVQTEKFVLMMKLVWIHVM